MQFDQRQDVKNYLAPLHQTVGGIQREADWRNGRFLTAVMAMAISYNWLFLWDYTFYKWGYNGL